MTKQVVQEIYLKYLSQSSNKSLGLVGSHENGHDNSGGHPNYHNDSHDNTPGAQNRLLKKRATN